MRGGNLESEGKKLILNIRGTHGSGKSTVVQDLMKMAETLAPVNPNPRGRPEGYRLTLPGVRKLVYVKHERDRLGEGRPKQSYPGV